jgi:hypothetical protein
MILQRGHDGMHTRRGRSCARRFHGFRPLSQMCRICLLLDLSRSVHASDARLLTIVSNDWLMNAYSDDNSPRRQDRPRGSRDITTSSQHRRDASASVPQGGCLRRLLHRREVHARDLEQHTGRCLPLVRSLHRQARARQAKT